MLVLWPVTENNYQYQIIDPYSLSDSIDATKLFESDIEANIIVQSYAIQSDIIIGWSKDEENLYMQSLIQENWINYLRNLNDYSNIGFPYRVSRIKLMIDDIINEYNNSNGQKINFPIKPSYDGTLYKWVIKIDDNISLIAHKQIKSKTQEMDYTKIIFYLFKKELKKYTERIILNCDLLENENLAMITIFGIYIWAIKSNGIRLHYFWNEEVKRIDYEPQSIINMLQEFLRCCENSILPTIQFDLLIRDRIKRSNDVNYLSLDDSRELLEDYKHDKVFLACYGKRLLEKLIEYKQDELIEDIIQRCIDLSTKNIKEGFTANIELLSVITSSFSELSQNYEPYISNFLYQIAFVVPHYIRRFLIKSESISSHLHHYGNYVQILETTFIDITISWLLRYLQTFIE
ncbi:8710_t:CDS:1, partial [Dentiscutata erythropus]